MNKFALILFIFLIAVSPIKAVREKIVSLSFSPEEFSLIEEDGRGLITSSTYNIVLKDDILVPAVPYICIYVLIGQDEKNRTSFISTSDSLFQDCVYLANNPCPVPTSKIGSYYNLAVQDNVSGSYPLVNAEYTGTQLIGGYKILSFLVCPFRYDSDNHTVFLCKEMEIKLQLETGPEDARESVAVSNQVFLEKLKKYVVNPEDMILLYKNSLDKDHVKAYSDCPSIQDAPDNYLIITCDSLKDEFQRLALWKTERGLKAEVKTVEDIYLNYSDRNNPLKIKHAIKDCYDLSNGALQYVLLGGGKDIVPIQNCHATFEDEVASAPSDLFYACIQDLEWDTNMNGKYGEVADSVCLYPAFALGRLPASDVSQARTMVDRILNYEMNPDTVGWKNEMLMCGACDTLCMFNGEAVSCFHAESERLYDTYINNEWEGTKFRFYDTGTDHVLDANYDVTSDNLQEELSKGYSFVNVLTHGFYFCWQMENERDYLYQEASSLHNSHPSFIVTQACWTNNISFSQSLGNTFMRNPYGGIIGYWGCSHDAFGVNHGWLGAIDHVTGSMYRSLFSVNRHVGDAIVEAQRNYLADYQSNSTYRWNHLFLLALTDPGLCVYTTKPHDFSEALISHIGNSINVNLGTPGFYACAMSRHDKGQTYWNSIGSNGSNFSFENLPVESVICAWYPDYIPYRTIFSSVVRLQNESLSNNLNVTADRVFIGSHVASGRDSGPVVVENGTSVISYTSEVVIENDFEVKPGACLEIRKTN